MNAPNVRTRLQAFSERLAEGWGPVIPLVTVIAVVWAAPWLRTHELAPVAALLIGVLTVLSAAVAYGAAAHLR